MPDDVFRWVVAAAVLMACLAFLVQAGVAIALYRIARKISDKALPLAERAEPILDNARKMLDENRPRLAEISTETLEIVKTARVQAVSIGELLDDATVRARARIAQIDETVCATTEQVGNAGEVVKDAVLRPAREVNAVMAGVKAALASYARGARRPSVDHATQDEEMFI